MNSCSNCSAVLNFVTIVDSKAHCGACGKVLVADKYLDVMKEAIELHDRKSADYGSGEDPYANIRAAADFGIPPWVGVAIRLNDKVIRVKSFCRNGDLANESLRDAFMDIINYAAFAVMLLDEQVE